MIIWIASYPKSGNTWIRSLLSAYLYSNDGIFDFNLLKKIHQFPSALYLKFFLKDFKDIKKVSNYWIAAQDRIGLFNDKPVFLKTHSALCKFENNSFTNKTNTKAVIYVVRDPRNLITSLSHHYSLNIEKSYSFITDKQKMIKGDDDFGAASILGDWSSHYKSWRDIKFAPILIIKYEDLLNNTNNTFKSILNFLSRFMDINLDEKKIISAVNSCSFETLVKKEKNEGFFEAVDKKKKFFYLGKKK